MQPMGFGSEVSAGGMSVAPSPRMTHRTYSASALWVVAALALTSSGRSRADDAAEWRRQLQLLQNQNAALAEQVRQQQSVIETLGRRVGEIEQRAAKPAAADDGDSASKTRAGFNLGRVNISGEGGVALFHTQPEGMWPNAEFRVDEAKLFFEAPVWGDIYFFTELNLATREHGDLDLRLGELYLDFENVSKLFGRDGLLNVRAGRMDIPFGEEYAQRDAIDNPLISHSLSDLWGVDEGVELYGAMGRFSYVFAVQNGGVSGTRDFNSDKSVAGRLSFDPTRWLHLSVSAMRTGDLDANNDFLSELWFGNGWFRSIGGTNTTKFHANLIEGDVGVRWPRGHLKAFGGGIRYDDNDLAADNGRDVYYYSVEVMQRVTGKLYAAARFSQAFADKGFPLVGHGEFNDYFFGEQTKELWRLSLGLGYRLSDHLLIKTEYTLERGKEAGGDKRDREDFFGAEAAFKF